MKDTDILFSDEFRRSVENNLGRDPVRIALDKKLSHAALVASQVKYLRRAERKLPSYHAARCIIPPLAFEQSSSEETAAWKDFSGELCIDLTCGLGVDSFFLSKKFRRVVAVERNPELATIARENFRRLGAANIEVVNASAEEFLDGFGGGADLIYADPDRRNTEGCKMVRIGDCSPDITALMPRIKAASRRLVVKLSPLFDVNEVFRVFGPHTRAEVVSAGGECKEVVAETADDIETPSVRAVAVGTGEVEYPFGDGWTAPDKKFTPERYRWLVVPDVSLQKARLAQRYFAEHMDWIGSENGYGFSAGRPESVMGKSFGISSIEPFDPKGLKRRLKGAGVRSVDIMKRDFPLSAADIARQLGVREGGLETIAFTQAAGRLWQIGINTLPANRPLFVKEVY